MKNSAVREALERTSAAITAEPAKARAKNVAATARLAERLSCEVTGPNGERLMTDMPPAMGGTAAAPHPGWLLRSALASCTATVIAMRAARLGVELDTLEVTVESESDARGILGLDNRISAALQALRTRVKIGGAADAETLRRIVTWADAHSPVGCTLRQSPMARLELELA